MLFVVYIIYIYKLHEKDLRVCKEKVGLYKSSKGASTKNFHHA